MKKIIAQLLFVEIAVHCGAFELMQVRREEICHYCVTFLNNSHLRGKFRVSRFATVRNHGRINDLYLIKMLMRAVGYY